jgi:hypothetical protein
MRRKRVEKRSVDVGCTVQTSYGKATLVVYIDSLNVVAQFEDGTLVTTTSSDFRLGNLRNRNNPTRFGIGYEGYGPAKFNSFEGRKWTSMIGRCYGNQDKNVAYYEDCDVIDLWHNFQNFAEWVKFQKGYGRHDWQLDKDWLGGGNLYCPEVCVLIPARVNAFLVLRGRERGEYPIGVTKCSRGKFQSQISNGRGAQQTLGYFETVEEAFGAYKVAKEAVAKELAALYEAEIDHRVFDALMDFVVDIND